MKVKSEREIAQSCLTLHDPMDGSLPGSSIHEILQARVLEWGAIAFSKLSSKKPEKEQQIKCKKAGNIKENIKGNILKINDNLQTINAGEGMEKRESSYTVGGECKLVQLLWKTIQRFLKRIKNRITI